MFVYDLVRVRKIFKMQTRVTINSDRITCFGSVCVPQVVIKILSIYIFILMPTETSFSLITQTQHTSMKALEIAYILSVILSCNALKFSFEGGDSFEYERSLPPPGESGHTVVSIGFTLLQIINGLFKLN